MKLKFFPKVPETSHAFLEPDQNNFIKKRRLSGSSETKQNSKKVCLSNSDDPFNDDFVIGTQDFEKSEELAFAKDAMMRKKVSQFKFSLINV